jgi:Flp pilus assembly pilin Flp
VIATMVKRFWKQEDGQDLVEYTLLIAFVCMCSAALFVGGGAQVAGIWSVGNSRLVVANTTAS